MVYRASPLRLNPTNIFRCAHIYHEWKKLLPFDELIWNCILLLFLYLWGTFCCIFVLYQISFSNDSNSMQFNNYGYKCGIIRKPIYVPLRQYQNIDMLLIHLLGIFKSLSPTPQKKEKVFWWKNVKNEKFSILQIFKWKRTYLHF